MALKLGLLSVCLLASAYLIAMFRSGLWASHRRRWPPRQVTVRSMVEIWGGSGVVFLSAYMLGILDADRVDWPNWLRYGVGAPLWGLGTGMVSFGMLQLGIARTSGVDGELVTSRIYGIIRHPQYVGHAIALIGWVLFTASLWSIPAVCAAFLALYWAIHAEDVWLALRHEDQHRDYRRRVLGPVEPRGANSDCP